MISSCSPCYTMNRAVLTAVPCPVGCAIAAHTPAACFTVEASARCEQSKQGLGIRCTLVRSAAATESATRLFKRRLVRTTISTASLLVASPGQAWTLLRLCSLEVPRYVNAPKLAHLIYAACAQLLTQVLELERRDMPVAAAGCVLIQVAAR